MEDEKYVYIQDIKEKKSTGRSAHNRRTHTGKGGAVRFPSDFMTRKERNAMNGEVKSYKLNSPMTWAKFRAMPDDLKVSYIKLLRQKYRVTDKAIAEMMGIGRQYLCKTLGQLGLAKGSENASEAKKNFDRAAWEKWVNGANSVKEEELTVKESFPITAPAAVAEAETAEEQEDPSVYVTTVPISGEMTFTGGMKQALHTALLLLEGAKGKITISWECEING